jgi:hypothetical protein
MSSILGHRSWLGPPERFETRSEAGPEREINSHSDPH